mgnify:CR=1 FL=1
MARHENYKILFGTNIARTAALTSVASVANGEIACVKSDMTILQPGETIANSDYIYIVQGTTGAPRFSAKIQGANVEKWTGTTHVAVTLGGGNSGISLTGVAQTYAIIDGYEQVYFKVSLDGGFNSGGTTTLDVSQPSPTFGSGTEEHVSDLERAALGYDGVNNLMKFPVPSYPVYTVAGTTYDIYAVTHSDRHSTANLNKDGYSPEMTLVAMADGGAGQQLAFEGEINPWMTSTPGNFANVIL